MKVIRGENPGNVSGVPKVLNGKCPNFYHNKNQNINGEQSKEMGDVV